LLSKSGEPGGHPGARPPASRRAIARPQERKPAYAPPKPPAWLREVLAAAVEELEAAPAAMAQVDLGPARPEPASGLAPGTARYRADLRGAGVDASTLRDLQLVPVASAPSGGGPPSVSVEMRHGDDLVVLGPAQPGEPRLSATVDPAGPPRALADALRAVTEPGLAERFESGVLDPPPSTVPPRPGLSPEEAAACAASCAPGFNVVWAPVGTDATRVVAEALASLAGAGHSVLLVSTVGHAVDRAVLQAAERLSAAVAGRLVRVGPPSLPEVADHPFLPLARARERRAAVHGEQVEELERRIAALRSEPDQLVLERAERLLAGFDPRRYERARALVDGADALARLERRAAEQELALEAARAEREQARAALAQAEAAVAEAGEAQDAYRQIDRLEGQMGTLQEELGEAKDHVRDLMRRLEASRNAVADFGRLSPVRRATRLGAGGRVRAARREAEAALLPAWEKVVGRERAAAQLREQIERELRRAGSISREEIDRRGQARAAARERLEAAGVAEEERERAHGAARAELERARQAPAPTEQDRRLVLAAEEQGLPELAGRIGELRAAARAGGEELARLDAERGRLSAATDALTSATVAAATVVATTMDRLAADEAVLGRGYDHVVVDQATAALPPAVVLAATLARRGVTLVGDPLQGGPASVLESRRPASVPVSRWLLRDCFALLGLDRPERLLDRPGCSALAPVRDLGPDAAELANRVAYQGRLPAGEHQQRPHPDDGPGELVLVDVAPFGELARIRTGVRSARREWWPVGALLAGAIATHHLDLGQPVALMAPHAAQLRLTEAAVLDAGLDERVEVGWPPRFQGRRFQVGVLDLVEGGRDRGWIAGSRLDGTRHELRGLRLFNLGVTRAERTYLLADRAAIERAERGPLAHVGDLWREGRVGLAGAGRFLSLERRPPADADPEAAAPTLLALEGSDFFDRLEADLAAAGGEVWVWSPQLATRPSPVIGWLADAAARGCQVTVFVKPPHEHRPNDERRLGALRAAGLTVVAIYGVAERMVVVDRRRSFIGNVNVLATPHERDEGMVLVEGGRFARALLEVEQAEAFRAAPSCARHPAARCYAQYYRRGHEKGWFWTCPWCGERRRLVLAPESAPPSG
jgi:hypothetical protein